MLSSTQIAEIINDNSNKERLENEMKRYEMYHGKLKKHIQAAALKEFFMPETVKNMIHRVVPINVTQKIINKLAKIYINPPARSDSMEIDSNNEFLAMYEDATSLNSIMKDANRYFKLCKHFAIESFVNVGEPQLRVLPPHTYTPISDDSVDPTRATYIVKHINFANNAKDSRHIVWSDFEHYTMDGEGTREADPLNPDGINPYGINPIYYGRQNLDQLIPIEDDDLMCMQIAICLLLTDLNFASKYAAWNLIYIISNAEMPRPGFNPNSVLQLSPNRDGSNPVVGTIERSLNIDGMLKQIETLIGLLLTTKSLKPGAMGSLTADNVASGVAKILDQSESMEDRTEQISYFQTAERYLFECVRRQVPIWSAAKLLVDPWATSSLSDEFELYIKFPEQKPIQTETEVIKNEVTKLHEQLTTQRRALEVINPDMSGEQIDQLLAEINKQKKEGLAPQMTSEG